MTTIDNNPYAVTDDNVVAAHAPTEARVRFLQKTYSLLLAAIWAPALALGSWISWRLRRRFRHARETNAALTSRIQETLAGIRVIKAYGLEHAFQQRFERDSHAADRKSVV